MSKLMYIRTDANSHLGIGHVMRCGTIASAWESAGGKTLFISSDEESVARIAEIGFDSVCLDRDWRNLGKELPSFVRFLRSHPADCLLLDSYFITHAYLDALAGRLKTIYLGMANKQAFPVDMLIDYTLMADRDYYDRHYPKETRKLTGCSFFPLRRQFTGVEIPIRERAEQVLLLTGATDPLHVAWKMADRLMADTDFSVHAVLGAYNTDKTQLYDLKEKSGGRLFLYENVKNMAELFADCDMAISAGGITLYELCACGVPTLSYAFADNQLPAVGCFAQKGIIAGVGDVRCLPDWTDRLVEMLVDLSRDKKKRSLMSERMKALVDGEGSRRIVEAVMDML